MVLIFGKNGQIASDLRDIYTENAFGDAVFLGSAELDLTKTDLIQDAILQRKPSLLINLSAYTKVDLAETEKDKATAVNELAVKQMALACKTLNIPMIHFSTDYVFDGSGDRAWSEEDPTSPLSWYGKSKLQGELALRGTWRKHLIFRTSWVYSSYGKNFLKTILRLASERENLRIVSDQVGAPTYARDLAQAVWTLQSKLETQSEFDWGTYHLCNSGSCSWFDFASAIVEFAKSQGQMIKTTQIDPILASEYPTPAKRPSNSRLNCTKAATLLGLKLPDWKSAMKTCLQKNLINK